MIPYLEPDPKVMGEREGEQRGRGRAQVRVVQSEAEKISQKLISLTVKRFPENKR